MPTDQQGQTITGGQAADDDVGGLGQVFFNGVPAMTGIVTMIAQPFAQDSMRSMFRLPEWMPIVVALLVSALLALHRMWIVRRYPGKSCAICVPLLMLIIFSAYVTGNNVVYYAKEGLSRPEGDKAPPRDEVAMLVRERAILRQQLESAQEVIATLRQALNLPVPAKPQSSRPGGLERVLTFLVGEVHAQAQPRSQPRPERPSTQDVQRALQKYEQEQRDLERKLDKVDQERQKTQDSQQRPPLIKSW